MLRERRIALYKRSSINLSLSLSLSLSSPLSLPLSSLSLSLLFYFLFLIHRFSVYSDVAYCQRYLVVTWLVPRETAAVSAHVVSLHYNQYNTACITYQITCGTTEHTHVCDVRAIRKQGKSALIPHTRVHNAITTASA